MQKNIAHVSETSTAMHAETLFVDTLQLLVAGQHHVLLFMQFFNTSIGYNCQPKNPYLC